MKNYFKNRKSDTVQVVNSKKLGKRLRQNKTFVDNRKFDRI